MTVKNLEIHSENILPIIKKWLYSDHDIFARELVANACDAIHKVQLLREEGKCSAKDDEFRINITIDKANKTLTFSDTGVGMDAAEVEKYIAQIAFSGAEDFMEHYKSKKEEDQFIGHFGLGFYSAYMVASKVDIETLSYKEGAEPVFWSCDGSSTYTIDKGSRKARGTDIILHINEENEDFLDEARMRGILEEYCAFLPYPVFLGDTRINAKDPLWIKSASECTEEDYLDFYRHLYPGEEDPLFWMHINVDYPFNLKGILYFPKLRRDFDPDKNSIRLFCNRVFVSDTCKDIVPNYLLALRGVIDSPDIPLNVSRSSLQVDRTVRQVGSHISKKVSDSLSTLYKNDRERFLRAWKDISTIVKLGILEDDKFYDRVKNILVWKEVGGEWRTAEEYLERNKEKTKDKIIYTRDPDHMAHFIDTFKKKGIEVLTASHSIDIYVMQALERKLAPATFQRVDAAIDETLIDKEREKTVLDASGKTEAAHLADFIRTKLDDATLEVEAKSLTSDTVPGFIVLDENQRRMRDYMMSLAPEDQRGALDQLQKRTFVVNTNNKLLGCIQKLDKKNPELAKELVLEVYDLAQLTQREMKPETLNAFINRTSEIMEKLTEAAIES